MTADGLAMTCIRPAYERPSDSTATRRTSDDAFDRTGTSCALGPGRREEWQMGSCMARRPEIQESHGPLNGPDIAGLALGTWHMADGRFGCLSRGLAVG
jgi:hypothetical protein